MHFNYIQKQNLPFLAEFARLCTKGVEVLEKGRIGTMSNWAKISVSIEGSGLKAHLLKRLPTKLHCWNGAGDTSLHARSSSTASYTPARLHSSKKPACAAFFTSESFLVKVLNNFEFASSVVNSDKHGRHQRLACFRRLRLTCKTATRPSKNHLLRL